MSYLKKITVTHRFKRDVLSEAGNIDDLGKLELWLMYLNMLGLNKEISKSQARTWKYPSKELK